MSTASTPPIPPHDSNAQHIGEVDAITPAIEAMAGESVSGVGRGGMTSKLIAARIATQAGSDVLIARGKTTHPLAALREGARHTRLRASTTPAAARKRWIAGGLTVEGTLTVDDGAVRALASGKSLLPAGVTRVEGRFERGDAVRICTPDGSEIGRGLAAYSAEDARAIAGRRSSEIAAILGYRGRDAMIHRDDLALTVGIGESEGSRP